MKVLVIGKGAQEHAIIWKLSQSRHVSKIYCCPGNAGIAEIAECIDVSPNDVDALTDFARYEWIDLTIVGDENTLLRGIIDSFIREGCKVVGPNKNAAQLGSSRVFSKDLMRLYGIPTAEYKVFPFYLHAEDYVRLKGTPLVIKADGRKEGTSTFIVSTTEEAVAALRLIMKDKIFGDAGKKVIVEEVLRGEEISLMIFTDGKTFAPLPISRNYKQILDDDKGSQTEGMGAYSPVPGITKEIEAVIMSKIIRPVLRALNSEGKQYKGILSADILISQGNPYVLGLSCTFGDPETQTVLPRLKTDLMEITLAIADDQLSEIQNTIEWREVASVCVVISSGGYPGEYQQGFGISGLENIKAMRDVAVFHSGTAYSNGNIITSGGRVLSISAIGTDVGDARAKAYRAAEALFFEGMYYRKDIGM